MLYNSLQSLALTSNLLKISVCLSHKNFTALVRYTKWEKKLSLYLTINIYNTIIYLSKYTQYI